METYTESFLVERVEKLQTQETMADEAFLVPQSRMEK